VAEEDTESRATIITTASQIPAAAAADPTTACLVVIYGGELGKRIPLGAQPLECGRALDTGLPLDDDAASRRHARFAWAGNGFVVRDLESTNGTWVNDDSVVERTLRDGDQVKIGRTIFKFIYGGNIELSYHEEIYRLMTFDGLTRVFNKRSFEEALQREVSRSQRYQRHLSLVLFDIDHFKRINDTRGHLAGDAVLRQLASLVVANVRREDIFARVGGEEFALLLPEVAGEGARTVAEKIRALVQRSTFRFEEQPIPVTASFGVASFEPESSLAPADLYRIADERLYQAKGSGRNRVA
jgi:diguanylate cyclase (GGDEF)-like protein